MPVIASPDEANVKVPESELIRLSAVNVIVPAKLLSPEMFLRAPSVEIPVPLKVNVSAPILIAALSTVVDNSSAPLGLTITPASVVPKAALF